MGFNSAFKGLKLLKKTGNGRLNNLNNLNGPVLNVLKYIINSEVHFVGHAYIVVLVNARKVEHMKLIGDEIFEVICRIYIL